MSKADIIREWVSFWRALDILGWWLAVILMMVSATLYANWHDRHARQCEYRWTFARTPVDTVRIAGDCGAAPPRRPTVVAPAFNPDSINAARKRNPRNTNRQP